MDLITFLIALVLAYVGLYLGMLFLHFAPEESEPGKNYFFFMQFALFAVFVFISSLLGGNSLFFVTGAIFLALFYLLPSARQYVSYFFFAIGLALNHNSGVMYLLFTIVLFYGIVQGSIFFSTKKLFRLTWPLSLYILIGILVRIFL